MIQSESLQEYFRKALTEAISRTSLQVSVEIQMYLIHMLLEFSRTDQAYSGVNHGEKPVYAIMLARAQDAEPQEALRLYKQVGDATLYQLGFFKGCISERPVNESYYVTIGESAYAYAANLSRPIGLNATLIYGELSHQFLGLVNVFNEISIYGDRIRKRGEISTERLLFLVENYKRTNNPSIREILIRQGVSMGPELKKT